MFFCGLIWFDIRKPVTGLPREGESQIGSGPPYQIERFVGRR